MAQSLAEERLGFLPRALLEPRNVPRAIGIGWLTAFLPSIALAAIVAFALPNVRQPEIEVDGVFTLWLIVVFAPIFETLIMGGALLVLLRLVSPALAIAASSIGWGIVHSLAAPAWGLVIWWPFLVFSTLFVTWRQRSLLLAFAMPALVHALHNLPSALLLVSADYL